MELWRVISTIHCVGIFGLMTVWFVKDWYAISALAQKLGFVPLETDRSTAVEVATDCVAALIVLGHFLWAVVDVSKAVGEREPAPNSVQENETTILDTITSDVAAAAAHRRKPYTEADAAADLMSLAFLLVLGALFALLTFGIVKVLITHVDWLPGCRAAVCRPVRQQGASIARISSMLVPLLLTNVGVKRARQIYAKGCQMGSKMGKSKMGSGARSEAAGSGDRQYRPQVSSPQTFLQRRDHPQ